MKLKQVVKLNTFLGKRTGRLMFQFDDDEAAESTFVYNNKCKITLHQQKDCQVFIEFISREGENGKCKKFKLFIENI